MLTSELSSSDWTRLRDGAEHAESWLRANAGDSRIAALVAQLVALGRHPKWEVRRAVASAASSTRHAAFDAILEDLIHDENRMVRQAAERASRSRRQWATGHAFAKEHATQIDVIVDDIEARFGQRGGVAVQRAAEKMVSIFTRELYHEVVKLLSPLATSAERLTTLLGEDSVPLPKVHEEARRIEERVERLQTVLQAMRAYAAQPRLDFCEEDVGSIVAEAVSLTRDRKRTLLIPAIEAELPSGVRAVVVRARLLQALTSILDNAVEAYEGQGAPIRVSVEGGAGQVTVRVRDCGVGMTATMLSEARSLFATSKVGGTGFGLPLAIKIVESELEGALRIESVRGEGTTVELVIPTRSPGGGFE